MDFKFYCQYCGQHIQTKTSMVGSSVNCPGCSQMITIPAPVSSLDKSPTLEKKRPLSPFIANAMQSSFNIFVTLFVVLNCLLLWIALAAKAATTTSLFTWGLIAATVTALGRRKGTKTPKQLIGFVICAVTIALLFLDLPHINRYFSQNAPENAIPGPGSWKP